MARLRPGRADVIVTDNLDEFPESALAPFDLEVRSTDEFLGNQLDLDPDDTMIAPAELRPPPEIPP